MFKMRSLTTIVWATNPVNRSLKEEGIYEKHQNPNISHYGSNFTSIIFGYNIHVCIHEF